MIKEGRYAFVFPGQGSQKVGMGESLVNNPDPELAQIARRTYEEASDVLNTDFSRICFSDPENQLDSTRITQPALLITSIAAHRMLTGADVRPDVVAGHSLGEYSALVAAEALSFEQALLLVSARGKFMEDAGEINPGKMAAILKLPLEHVQEICEESGAQIANINSEQQIVIAGKNDSVTYASEMARDRRGRVIGLNVSIASHCDLMQPAQENMKILLRATDINNPTIPFIANVTAEYMQTGDQIRRGLVDQMTGTVLWLDSIKKMTASGDGVRSILEVGPGSVLTNLMKHIDTSVDTNNTDRMFPAPIKEEQVLMYASYGE